MKGQESRTAAGLAEQGAAGQAERVRRQLLSGMQVPQRSALAGSSTGHAQQGARPCKQHRRRHQQHTWIVAVSPVSSSEMKGSLSPTCGKCHAAHNQPGAQLTRS